MQYFQLLTDARRNVLTGTRVRTRVYTCTGCRLRRCYGCGVVGCARLVQLSIHTTSLAQLHPVSRILALASHFPIVGVEAQGGRWCRLSFVGDHGEAVVAVVVCPAVGLHGLGGLAPLGRLQPESVRVFLAAFRVPSCRGRHTEIDRAGRSPSSVCP